MGALTGLSGRAAVADRADVAVDAGTDAGMDADAHTDGAHGTSRRPSAATSGASRPVVELIERDGQVRPLGVVQAWPLRIGRALDNDVVLGDPHVAAHQLSIDETAAGLVFEVGEGRNGVLLQSARLHSGQRATLPTRGEAIGLTLGRTRLRIRLPGHVLAPETALAPPGSLARRASFFVVAALVVLGSTVFATYLETDPDLFGNAAAAVVLATVAGTAVWCGAWALLSKTFAHQARFGWHLRVFLLSSTGLLAVKALPPLLAFMFSWPWITDFAFVAEIALAAAALYFHLLAVEPARRRLLKAVAVACAAVAVGLSLWFNVQRHDLFGDELYMSHLFSPALRLARPAPAPAFVGGIAPLKAVLDRKAKQTEPGDDAGAEADDDNN